MRTIERISPFMLYTLHVADLDTSPKKRRETPDFYGYIPATGRGLIFLMMMVNSTAQFLAKITAMALLAAVSKTWAFGYIVGDILLYLVYTLVRNDFFYFLPIQSYIGSIGVSLLIRISEKVRVCVWMISRSTFICSFICYTTTGRRGFHSHDNIQERF